MANLNEVKAEVVTHYGVIKVDIRRKNDKLHMTFEVPEGTEAYVVKRGREHRYGGGKHSVKL